MFLRSHFSLRRLGLSTLALCGTVAAIAVSSPLPAPRVDITPPEVLTPIQLDPVSIPEAPFVREAIVQAKDTLPALFSALGLRDQALLGFVASDPQGRLLARRLKPGMLMVAHSDRDGQMLSVTVPRAENATGLVLRRDASGQISLHEEPIAVEHRTSLGSGVIRSSLFAATDEADLPDKIASSLVEIFSTRINFHSDLRKGDRFRVIYDTTYYNGVEIGAGKILAASFDNGDKHYSAVRYTPAGGTEAFYTEQGQSLKQGFLRSPLAVTRVSSGFSMQRAHPLFHDIRKHTGTDFAAPIGTPVKATASGAVAFVGRQNGYGNLLVLKHDKGVSTAYGHLNAFAPNIKRGVKVQQGQTIGFVGQTGWATGPHLHYEFRMNGTFLDPQKVALPEATPLTGAQLADFRTKTASLIARLDQATTAVASNE